MKFFYNKNKANCGSVFSYHLIIILSVVFVKWSYYSHSNSMKLMRTASDWVNVYSEEFGDHYSRILCHCFFSHTELVACSLFYALYYSFLIKTKILFFVQQASSTPSERSFAIGTLAEVKVWLLQHLCRVFHMRLLACINQQLFTKLLSVTRFWRVWVSTPDFWWACTQPLSPSAKRIRMMKSAVTQSMPWASWLPKVFQKCKRKMGFMHVFFMPMTSS